MNFIILLLKNYNIIYKLTKMCTIDGRSHVPDWEGSMMLTKNDQLVSVICNKCKTEVCKALPGSMVRCPKCKSWSTADLTES